MHLTVKLLPLLKHDGVLVLAPHRLAFVGWSSRPYFQQLHSWFENSSSTNRRCLLAADDSMKAQLKSEMAIIFDSDPDSANNYLKENFVTVAIKPTITQAPLPEVQCSQQTIIRLTAPHRSPTDNPYTISQQHVCGELDKLLVALRPRNRLSISTAEHTSQSLDDLTRGDVVNNKLVTAVTWTNFTNQNWQAYLKTTLLTDNKADEARLLAARRLLSTTPFIINLTIRTG